MPLGKNILIGIAASVGIAFGMMASEASAGSKFFDAAHKVQIEYDPVQAGALAEQGWHAVAAAGPTGAGLLRAEAIYNQAEAFCADQKAQVLLRRLQYMHADNLIRRSEYVKAERVLKKALTEEEKAQRSPLHVAFLQSMAFVREQQDDMAGAEA